MTELPQLRVLHTKVMNVWLDDITMFAPVEVSPAEDTLRCEVRLSASTKRAILYGLLDQRDHTRMLLRDTKWVSDRYVLGVRTSEEILLPDIINDTLVPVSTSVGTLCRTTLSARTGDMTLVGTGSVDLELFTGFLTNGIPHALYARVTNVTFDQGPLRCADLRPHLEHALDDMGSALEDFTSEHSLIAAAYKVKSSSQAVNKHLYETVRRTRLTSTPETSRDALESTRTSAGPGVPPTKFHLERFSEAHNLPGTRLWVCISDGCCKEGETICNEEDMEYHLLLFHTDKVTRITGMSGEKLLEEANAES